MGWVWKLLTTSVRDECEASFEDGEGHSMSVSKYNLQSKEKYAKNVCLPYSAVKTHEVLFWYEKIWIWLVQCPTVGQGIIFCVCLVVHTKISKPQT